MHSSQPQPVYRVRAWRAGARVLTYYEGRLEDIAVVAGVDEFVLDQCAVKLVAEIHASKVEVAVRSSVTGSWTVLNVMLPADVAPSVQPVLLGSLFWKRS